MQCLCCCTVMLTALSLIIRAGDYWCVSSLVGEEAGWLRAKVGEADLLLPPVQGWDYYDFGDKKWESDTTMECSREVLPASLSSIAKKIEEEERTLEEARREQPLAAEVYTAAKNEDFARVKELQQLETSGDAITTTIIITL